MTVLSHGPPCKFNHINDIDNENKFAKRNTTNLLIIETNSPSLGPWLYIIVALPVYLLIYYFFAVFLLPYLAGRWDATPRLRPFPCGLE